MVLHGGWYETLTPGNFLDALNVNGQTWERDASGAWQFVTDQGPSPRYGHAMAYDEVRGVTVLFGGYLCQDALCNPGGPEPNGEVYSDTWEWDGVAWTERVVASPPQARWGHAMAYDPVRQRIVMFGGRGVPPGSVVIDVAPEVWEWDGSTWATRPTSPDPTIASWNSPGGRYFHGLAFDRARNVLVLHGGFYYLPTSNGAGETWELSGSGEWRLRALPPNLTEGLPYLGLALPDHAMTYDYDRGATLLTTHAFENGANLGRLWDWTGSAWTPRASFPWRAGVPIAYDGTRMRTAIVGGEAGYISRADVWEWRYFDAPPMCEPVP
jgi:hypothetical protein